MLLILFLVTLCHAQFLLFEPEFNRRILIDRENSFMHNLPFNYEIRSYQRSNGRRVPVMVHDWLVAPNIGNNIINAARGFGYDRNIPGVRGLIAVNGNLADEPEHVIPLRHTMPPGSRGLNVCPPGFCAVLLESHDRYMEQASIRYVPAPPPRCGTNGDNSNVPNRENVHWRPPASPNAIVGGVAEHMGFFASCDEYPFSTTHIFGFDTVENIRVSCVPDREQVYQGALVSTFYACMRMFYNRERIRLANTPQIPLDEMEFYVAITNLPDHYVDYVEFNAMLPHFVTGIDGPNHGIGYLENTPFREYNPTTNWAGGNTSPNCAPIYH